MGPLEREIRLMIRDEGPMSLERYMELALGHPQYGYYRTRDPFGAGGDFTTAPEISQMFGELLGLWAAEVWAGMGAPRPVRLVELGPGRGALICDALRAARIVPTFREAVDLHLVETSPTLRALQKGALAIVEQEATWHDSLDEVPDGPSIILANEFFDALPVRHYVRTARGWRERLVGVDADDRLVFGLSPNPDLSLRADAPDGTVLEVSPAGHRLVASIARRIAAQGGAALLIDYGHVETSYGETLQAVRRHRPQHPLVGPGEADLTAHVDFAALARSARASGADVQGPQTQADFLLALGLAERAAALTRHASAEQTETIAAGRDRLIDRSERGMGAMFKAMALTPAGARTPPGFPEPGQS